MTSRPAIAILLAASLTACASHEGPLTDQAGNVYPPQCRGDLSKVEATITFKPRQWMAEEAAILGYEGRILGETWGNHIVIDDSLRGWKREDTLRHERCHLLMGQWHK
jgi:hypothetical protein